MKKTILVIFLLSLTTSPEAQQTVVTCPSGQVPISTLTGQSITVTCTNAPPIGTAPVITAFNVNSLTITLGQSITFTFTVTGNPVPIISINNGVGTNLISPVIFVPKTTGQIVFMITAVNSVGKAKPHSWTVMVNPAVLEPIYPGPVTDPNLLGNCSEARHNSYLLSGEDGFRYWQWHPQNDPSGCIYAHEHGANPAPIIKELVTYYQAKQVTTTFTQERKNEILAYIQKPILMGYVTRRAPNHPPEPHGGFKIFYALYNEENDEDRFSTMLSLHMTHMGTGGVGRFTQSHHSVTGWQVHIPSGAYEINQLMVNFGTPDVVCDPRNGPLTRDFIAINTSRCKISSPYEIWVGSANIREGTQQLFTKFATPAVFDPITVHNLQNSSEVVYAWDPRVLASRAFSSPSWMDFRGCNREAYAQPGYYSLAGDFMKWTDSFGNVVPQSLNALQQWFGSPIVTSNLRGSTPTGNEKEGNHAFKKPRANCSLSGSLKLLN